MFVLTPPSERTPLTNTVSIIYTPSSEDYDIQQIEDDETCCQYKCRYFQKINCWRNVKGIGNSIITSMNNITYWKLFLFCLFEWNFYTTMKMIYPFDQYFATFYGIPMTQFSYITSSYDFGSFMTVLLILIPCIHFKQVSIRVSLTLIFILNGIIQFTHTISTTFYGLFILRGMNGMLGALAWSQITGSIGAFLKSKYKRTYGVIIHESSSLLSTLSFVPIGYILYHYDINLCWYILAALSIIFAIISFFLLPSTSVYHASRFYYADKQKKRIIKNNQSAIISTNSNSGQATIAGDDESIQTRNTSIIGQFQTLWHLYLLYGAVILTQFPFIMFYATFGPWLTHEFELNSERLGFETLTINLGEIMALILTVLIIRSYSNVFCVLVGSFGCCSIAVFFALLLDMKVYNEVIVLILICLYVMFKEMIILNAIICTLNFSPIGYESICSLVLLLFIDIASMIGTIIGPDIIEKHSFPVLSRIIAIISLIQLLIAWSMTILYRDYMRAFIRRYSLSFNSI